MTKDELITEINDRTKDLEEDIRFLSEMLEGCKLPAEIDYIHTKINAMLAQIIDYKLDLDRLRRNI